MAMNKKEQAEMDRLRDELRIAKSFRFTETVEPDVMPPVAYGKENAINGWYMNPHNGSVCLAATSSAAHTTSPEIIRAAWTQGSKKLYSTRLLALKAGRCAMEQKFAKLLADIDRKIEEER